MAITQRNASLVRRLVDEHPDGIPVISLYFDLDPSRFATPDARASETTSLVDEARRQIEAASDLDHDELLGLRAALEQVDQVLRSEPVNGARSLAIFASATGDVVETIRVPRSIESRVTVARRPHVAPLAEALPGERWCVALVSRRNGRVMVGSTAGLREVDAIQDDVPGRHDQGGWSQRRFQERIDNIALAHLRRVADALAERLRREPYDHLAVGCPAELRGELRSRLHPDVLERFAGFFDVEVEHVNEDQARSAATPVFEQRELDREREAVERLDAGLARGSGAVAGYEDVSDALNQQRVEMLLYEPGPPRPGSRCQHCGWIGAADADRCPLDGSQVDRLEDATDALVAAAIDQSADVRALRNVEQLTERGGVAALLRF